MSLFKAVYEFCHHGGEAAACVMPDQVAAWSTNWDPIETTIYLKSGQTFVIRGYLDNALRRMCKESLGYDMADDICAQPPADSYTVESL